MSPSPPLISSPVEVHITKSRHPKSQKVLSNNCPEVLNMSTDQLVAIELPPQKSKMVLKDNYFTNINQKNILIRILRCIA